MLWNQETKRNLLIVLMAVVAAAGVATAEVSYHLVTIPEIGGAGAISDSGVILAGSMLVQPARDAEGNPVWDSDGDGIADGYTKTTLDPGTYVTTWARSINESLDVVGYGADVNFDEVALLWKNTTDGHTLVQLGRSFTDAEMETFTSGVQINALSINDLGQVLVYEHGADYSGPDPSNWTEVWALALVNPKDTDGDGKPDLWFEDLDEDGANDLMVELQYGTRLGGGWGGEGCINNRGQVAAVSDLTGRAFVVLPRDTDGDGEPDLWFEDLDGDGWNDLETDLGPDINVVALSDSGAVVGTEIVSGKDDHFLRWQIDEAGSVELVAKERGAVFMHGVNNLGQAVGASRRYLPRDRIKSTTILWEPDLTIIDLLDLLDNPSRTTQSLRSSDISNTSYIVGTVLDNYPQATVGFIAVPIAPSPPGAGPSVDSIAPITMKAGATIDVTISGSGFQAGATVTFANGKGQVPAANVTSVDATTIEATVTAHRKAKPGVKWDVRVTNPDGSSDVLVDGFTVTQ